MPSQSHTSQQVLLGAVVLTTTAAALALRRPNWKLKGVVPTKLWRKRPAWLLRRRGWRREVGSALPREGGCIYLDYAATCPIYPEVAEAMVPYLFRHWGNPSSGHAYGRPCSEAVSTARTRVARMLGAARPEEVFFCSCGSEADNWALVGGLDRFRGDPNRTHAVVSSIEHPAVLACAEYLAKTRGTRVTVVGCDMHGQIDPQAVAQAVIPGKTAVVSIMMANNEVGAVQDVAAIARLVKDKDPEVLVHTDAAQAVGKIPVDVRALGVDALTLVGHKFGAPKGVAALYVRSGVELPSVLHGGGQERGKRAGTEAVPNIVALGEAAQIWIDQGRPIVAHSLSMRDRLAARLRDRLAPAGLGLRVNGPLGRYGGHSAALPNVLSLAVAGVRASDVLAGLGSKVAASAGAACHTGHVAVSGVLRALDVPALFAAGTFRLSVGRHTTPEEVDDAADLLANAILRYLNTTRGDEA